MKRIVVVSPTRWDSRLFAGKFPALVVDHPSMHVTSAAGLFSLLRPFDVLKFIDYSLEQLRTQQIAAVVATDEYLACSAASIIAQRLGLPAPSPKSVLLCQHKYYSRQVQRSVVPHQVPEFRLLNPFEFNGAPKFPVYVKPVKATQSLYARKFSDYDSLKAFYSLNPLEKRVVRNVLEPFNALLRRYTGFEHDASFLIAEDVLSGNLVTVEGLLANGKFMCVGITDSTMYPGTDSFMRFDYPSKAPQHVQTRMIAAAEKVARASGLDDTIFNIEMFYRSNSIHILEINPRIASQFADLYEKVDGFNSYDLLLQVALGETPTIARGRGKYSMASSFVLRKFEDARIVKAPAQAMCSAFDDAVVQTFGKAGDRLSDLERGFESYRYAIINVGGNSEDELQKKFLMIKAFLDFRFSDSR